VLEGEGKEESLFPEKEELSQFSGKEGVVSYTLNNNLLSSPWGRALYLYYSLSHLFTIREGLFSHAHTSR